MGTTVKKWEYLRKQKYWSFDFSVKVPFQCKRKLDVTSFGIISANENERSPFFWEATTETQDFKIYILQEGMGIFHRLRWASQKITHILQKPLKKNVCEKIQSITENYFVPPSIRFPIFIKGLVFIRPVPVVANKNTTASKTHPRALGASQPGTLIKIKPLWVEILKVWHMLPGELCSLGTCHKIRIQ